MRSRTVPIGGSIAALAFAATPVAAVAAAGQHDTSAAHFDRSRDIRGLHHVDRSRDHTSADTR